MAIPDPRALVAFNRFGLGPRPGDLAGMTDAREAILAELNAPRGALIDDPALQRTPQALQAVYEDQERKKLERERAAQENLARLGMPAPNAAALIEPELEATATGSASPPGMASSSVKPQPPIEQQIFRAEAAARLGRACAASIGFS